MIRPCWYAVQTKSRQEERAAANLLTLGVETLLPKTKEIRAYSSCGKGGISITAFFPSYLFVKCDLSTAGQKIRYTRGVIRIVGTPDHPIPLEDSVITLIRNRMGPDGIVRAEPSLRIGDRVRITAGPLRNLVGILESPRNPIERVAVLLAIVNSHAHVVIERACVQSV